MKPTDKTPKFELEISTGEQPLISREQATEYVRQQELPEDLTEIALKFDEGPISPSFIDQLVIELSKSSEQLALIHIQGSLRESVYERLKTNFPDIEIELLTPETST